MTATFPEDPEELVKLEAEERVAYNEGAYEILDKYNKQTQQWSKIQVKIEDIQRRKYWKLRCKDCYLYGEQWENKKYYDYQKLFDVKNNHQYRETFGRHTEIQETEHYEIVKEVRICNRTYIIVYNTESLRVQEVNGLHIGSIKCAYVCRECGAVYASKGLPNHSVFPTEDPRCNKCTHSDKELRHICECETVV